MIDTGSQLWPAGVPRPRRTCRRWRATGVALGLAASGACATWRPVGGADPVASLRASPPADVRVTVSGWPGSVVLHSPQVVGDSLVGTHVADARDARGSRLAVPIGAIRRVEKARDISGRVGLVVLGLLGAAAIGLTLFVSGMEH